MRTIDASRRSSSKNSSLDAHLSGRQALLRAAEEQGAVAEEAWQRATEEAAECARLMELYSQKVNEAHRKPVEDDRRRAEVENCRAVEGDRRRIEQEQAEARKRERCERERHEWKRR